MGYKAENNDPNLLHKLIHTINANCLLYEHKLFPTFRKIVFIFTFFII